MYVPAERVLLVLACVCMAGAAVGLYVQRGSKPETTAVQEAARQPPATQQQDEEEPRRYPLPAGPRKFP